MNDIGINMATEQLKGRIIAVINDAKLPAVCLKLVCREVSELVDKAYEEEVEKERQERMLRGDDNA